MINLSLFIIMAHLILESQQQFYFGYPGELHLWSYKTWVHNMSAKHLRYMTTEIYRDVLLRAEHAKQLQETYKDDVTYELGSTAANIQSTFAHMLEVYRLYANISDFIALTHHVDAYIRGYKVIQGDYNQIRLEQEKFQKISESYEKNKDEHDRIKAIKALKASMLKAEKEERKRSRRRSSGQFYNGKILRRTTTRKRLWEYKVKWFSENDRLQDF